MQTQSTTANREPLAMSGPLFIPLQRRVLAALPASFSLDDLTDAYAREGLPRLRALLDASFLCTLGLVCRTGSGYEQVPEGRHPEGRLAAPCVPGGTDRATAYDLGRTYAVAGRSPSPNPFPPCTEERLDFEEGFEDERRWIEAFRAHELASSEEEEEQAEEAEGSRFEDFCLALFERVGNTSFTEHQAWLWAGKAQGATEREVRGWLRHLWKCESIHRRSTRVYAIRLGRAAWERRVEDLADELVWEEEETEEEAVAEGGSAYDYRFTDFCMALFEAFGCNPFSLDEAARIAAPLGVKAGLLEFYLRTLGRSGLVSRLENSYHIIPGRALWERRVKEIAAAHRPYGPGAFIPTPKVAPPPKVYDQLNRHYEAAVAHLDAYIRWDDTPGEEREWRMRVSLYEAVNQLAACMMHVCTVVRLREENPEEAEGAFLNDKSGSEVGAMRRTH